MILPERLRLMNRALSLVCVLLVPAASHAAEVPGPERVTAPFWREVGHPGARRARALLRQATHQIREAERQLPGGWRAVCERTRALSVHADAPLVRKGRERALATLLHQALRRRAHLDNALVRLRRAVELAPSDPEILFARARALSSWEEPGPLWDCVTHRRNAEAIAAYARLRRADPRYAASDVAHQLGILHTRSHEFGLAAKEYERAVALALDDRQKAVARYNLAEVTMLAGDLQRAVSYYRRAMQHSQAGDDYALALWGLGVALDRLGEHDAALETVTRAIEAEQGTMSLLRSNQVFFEPRQEIHYYEALGYEALAELAESDRDKHLRAAAKSWQAFLQAEGEDSRWYTAATQNQRRIRSLLEQREPTRIR